MGLKDRKYQKPFFQLSRANFYDLLQISTLSDFQSDLKIMFCLFRKISSRTLSEEKSRTISNILSFINIFRHLECSIMLFYFFLYFRQNMINGKGLLEKFMTYWGVFLQILQTLSHLSKTFDIWCSSFSKQK